MENPFDDNYFMKKALQEAELAFEHGEVPVGAIIVAKNRIIGRAHNLTNRSSFWYYGKGSFRIIETFFYSKT